MKAAVVFALVAGVSAIAPVCVIPDQYVTTTAGACTSAATGYSITGVCQTGVDSRFVNTDNFPITTVDLDANPEAFTANAATAVDGCVVPTPGFAWGTGSELTVGDFTGDCGRAGGAGGVPATGVINPLAANNGNFKGVSIQCADGFYPTQGTEGVNLCYPGTPLAITNAANIFQPAPADATAYFTPGGSQSLAVATGTGADAALADTIPQFTGSNALVCSSACVLPDTLCSNGAIRANIIASSDAFLTDCRILPTSVLNPIFLEFACRSTANVANSFVATCNNVGTTDNFAATITPAFTGQCGTIDGAQSAALFDDDNNLEWAHFPVAGAQVDQAAGEIENFPLVTSVLTLAYTVAGGDSGAQNTIWRRQWNNNPFQAFRAGNVYNIDVTGCAGQIGEAYTRCVQQTLNWWRCESEFPFETANCYANNVLIPCPAFETGFRCESSSKKGLLLLLLLLLLIPLCCLLCCCLLLCCIRRKKTEADVHFATFDPLGAPAMTTAVVPTAVPTACATPYASAVPCY